MPIEMSTRSFTKYVLFFNFFSILAHLYCEAEVVIGIIVQTDKGRVQGHTVRHDNYRYMSYLGIPYAAAMTGQNRFKAPLPVKPWSDVLQAKRNILCPQLGIGDENCLVVNVFTPIKLGVKPLPVVVLIRGGAFYKHKTGHIGEEQLVRKGIIVVNFGYRLGALGFLCLRTEGAPGNAGQKDQVAALKWIQRNIASFGGDPRKVTLFGVSSGAAQVHLLILSKMAKGLFQKAVLDGGSALNVWAIDYNPLSTAKEYANMITSNYFANISDKDLLDFYRTVSAKRLSGKIGLYYLSKLYRDANMGFVPCIERSFNGTEAFLSAHPLDILNQRRYTNVPMLITFATYEAINFIAHFFDNKQFKSRLKNRFEEFLPSDLVFADEVKKKLTAENLKRNYLRNNTKMGYMNYFSDLLVTYGILKTAKLHSKYNTVYLMEFALASNMASKYKGKAGHAAFYYNNFPEQKIKNKRDRYAVEIAVTITENFVKYGNPSPKSASLLATVWLPVRHGQPMPYLYLDYNNITLLRDPHKLRMNLWDNMYNTNWRRSGLYIQTISPSTAAGLTSASPSACASGCGVTSSTPAPSAAASP